MKALHYAIVLAAICIVAALGVAGTYRMTKPLIEEKKKAADEKARKEVVPGEGNTAPSFELLNPDAAPDDQVVKAVDDAGKVLGYAALGEAQGYSSRIRIMVGMDAKVETLSGVQIVSQEETPGLGTRIAEVKTDKTILGLLSGKEFEENTDPTPEFLKQFIMRRCEQIKLRADGGTIDGLSGATISSRASVAAVCNAIEKITAVVEKGGDDDH